MKRAYIQAWVSTMTEAELDAGAESSRTGNPVPPGIKVCSAAQRRRTPPLFAEYLVRLARSVEE
jgi:hypothetical protein